jgi:hypothetical protein
MGTEGETWWYVRGSCPRIWTFYGSWPNLVNVGRGAAVPGVPVANVQETSIRASAVGRKGDTPGEADKRGVARRPSSP